MTNNSRIVYFDALNVLSCMAVVFLHSNGYIHSFIKDEYWGVHVGIETIFIFAVPIFFMLSGATLFNYRLRYSTKEFIKKRITKAFIPYIIWGIIFFMLFYIANNGAETNQLTWRFILIKFINGNIPLTNYWFFIPLFFLYAFMPFLSLMIKMLNISQVRLLCYLMVLFQSIIPTLLAFIGIETNFPLPITGYILYAILGYYLSISELEKNNKLLIILCISTVISLIIRYYLIYNSDYLDTNLLGYFSLFCLLHACTVFLIVKRVFSPNSSITSKYSSFIYFFASKSYGVFLLHTFLIRFFDNVTDLNMSDVLFIPTAFCFSYISSIIIVYMFQKFKITSYLVP